MDNRKGTASESANRRSFLKKGILGAGAATLAAGMLPRGVAAFNRGEDDGGPISKGDIAILTFLSALEQVEADLWTQYAELGGAATKPGNSPIDLPFTTGLAPAYITGLLVLDGDMPQYIADNTDDELSHHSFLNNYLVSKGAEPVDLRPQFANLPPSQVKGVPQTGRLTNLKQLTVDTRWWTRYRSATANPDFGGALRGPFDNAVPDLATGQHPAIPLNDNDLVVDGAGNISNHLQAIANTAGFHFAFIEVSGTSLYPALAQKVKNLEVLRVLLSIGGSEIMHFQTWHDKAGNAKPLTDGALTFPDLTNDIPQTDALQSNLIMPEPTVFLDPALGPVSIIRPTSDQQAGAVASVISFSEDGLFLDPATNKNTGIFDALMLLAEPADAARR